MSVFPVKFPVKVEPMIIKSSLSFVVMYVHWADHFIHRLNGIMSLFVNGLLVFVIHDDKKTKMGDYRYLILTFATFNVISTITDNLVPLCVHDHNHAFSVFIVDGFFEKKSVLGTVILSIRCSLISAAYGVLHSHFVFRYMALYRSKILTNYFVPYGLLLTVLNCAIPMTIWIAVCYLFLSADDERRMYMQHEISEHYQGDVFDANILIALYKEASEEVLMNSWWGIGIISAISVASVVTDIVLGILIITKLRSAGLIMSDKMLNMQKQFMKALTVQVTVPMIASFLPCLYAWYKPMFNISIGQWIDSIDVIAISLFPVMDPLALFYFVPAINNRLKQLLGIIRNVKWIELTKRSSTTDN